MILFLHLKAVTKEQQIQTIGQASNVRMGMVLAKSIKLYTIKQYFLCSSPRSVYGLLSLLELMYMQ